MKSKRILLLFLALGLCTASAFAADKGFSGDDKTFFKEAVSGGMMEVKLGEMAQQKAQAADVKDFGKRMVTDHGKANDELKALAQQKGEKVPDKMEHKNQKVVDKLNKASAAEFDKEYMQTMIQDHTTDLEDFKDFGMKAKDPDLKAWATKTTAVIEDHLKTAKDIGTKMGLDVFKLEEQGLKDAKKPKTK